MLTRNSRGLIFDYYKFPSARYIPPIELIQPFHAITVAGVQLNRESHAWINRKRVINHPYTRYDSTVEWFSTKGVAIS